MANCDTFNLRFFALLSFWSENHTPYHIDRGHSFDRNKKFSRSDEAFSQTDVKTNVYKRMLGSRLPWQLDLFSSQIKTFVSEITGRIQAWKQADSCSEDLPLAIQIGQCLLLVGFNGKFAFFTVGRCTNTEAKFSSQTQPRKCAPTANLDTQLTAFCTRSTFCTRCSKPVADFWLQIWLILRVWHTSRPESASAQNQCLAYSSFSSCSLFEFSPFQKNAHDFAVRYRSSCAHDAAMLVTLSKLLPRVKYRCFIRVFNILHSIVPSIPCLTTKWKNKTKTSITSWQKEKRNNNENEAPQRVNARRHQKPCRSPGLNRIPTPIRVNRFINSAKSSSSCFF